MKILSLPLLCLAACGSSGSSGTDFAKVYVGDWTGQISVSSGNNSPVISTVLLPIEETDSNVVELQGFCTDTDVHAEGPLADTAVDGFTIRTDSCSFSSVACQSGNLGFAWKSGIGAVTNGTLNLTIAGTLSCAGSTTPYLLTFTASQRTAYGALLGTPGGRGAGQALQSF